MKVVLYHKHCTDGFFSAYVLWLKYGSDALYIPVNYKPIQDMEPLEALEYIFNDKTNGYLEKYGNTAYKASDVNKDNYKDVDLIVVDYSFPVEHFNLHVKLFKSVLVLDHHESAIRDYSEFFPYETNDKNWKTITVGNTAKVILSEHESGAKLCHLYYYPEHSVPYYIELVSDRDLWKFNYPETRIFYYGIKFLNCNNFNEMSDIVNNQYEYVLTSGRIYEKDVAERIENVRNSGTKLIKVLINDKEYDCGIVNSYLDIASDLCSTIMDKEKCSLSIAYTIKKDNKVTCSLRSIKEIDSLPISSKFGGGGHKNASGFTITVERLLEILTTERLEV